MTVSSVSDTARKATSWIGDFQKFISRGSVVDLAVGVAVGTAFTAIVNSLVNDIIMPLVGVLLGGVDFSSLSITVGEASINYGMFIQAIINFLIIALVMFWLIRVMNRFYKKEAAKPAAAPADVVLLTEIRDLLKQQAV
jgi:large conductance mechanosensitive channel